MVEVEGSTKFMEEEADTDCPVCLEDTRSVPGLPVTVPCCRKTYCRACIHALVGAQKGNPPVGPDGVVAKNWAHILVCPTCRAEHHVPGGSGEQWARKLALDNDASAWGGSDTRELLLLEKDQPASANPELCSALSREELVAVCVAAGGAQHEAAPRQLGLLDRSKLIAEAARRLGSSSGEGLLVSELSIRAARSVLTLRDIPFGDCIEKAELVVRVEQSHRGACSKLPVKLLKRMLEAEGLGDEIFVDKNNLARRVMAVRALRRQSQATLRNAAAFAPAVLPTPAAAAPTGRSQPARPLHTVGVTTSTTTTSPETQSSNGPSPPSAQLRQRRFRARSMDGQSSGGCQCVVC
jgi:hypothetical protein